MMEICVLASGSSGNCTYIGNNGKGILIDAGITNKDLCNRLSLIGKDISNIKAIFLSHEHIDHIRGIDVSCRRNNLQLFANNQAMKSYSSGNGFKNIENNSSYKIHGFRIMPISVSHDAANPFGFVIDDGDKKAGVFTDLGIVNEELKSVIRKVDSLVIEANHDPNMLENGPYPYYLKQRIKSNYGHLSNFDSALTVMENAHSRMRNIFLAHLSRQNNTKEIAENAFKSLVFERKDLTDVDIIVTDQSEPTSCYQI